MFYIEKTWKFRVGHRLKGHPKCGNVHGEWLQITLTWASETLDPESGMVIDFGTLSERVGKKLEKLFDHVFLVDRHDREMVEALESLGVKYLPLDGPPTAENIARFVFHEFEHEFPSSKCKLVLVRVVESENNTVYYEKEARTWKEAP